MKPVCSASRPFLGKRLRPGKHYPHVTWGGTHAYRHVTLYHVIFWRQAVGGDNIPVISVSVSTILTSHELMWCYACSWDVTDDLPLNSMVQIHTSVTVLTSRDLTSQHASHISVVAHISWGELTWREESVTLALPSTLGLGLQALCNAT